MQIRKYAIDLASMGAHHAIPEGAVFLDLQVQRGVPVMWWSVPDGDVPTTIRTFSVAPTGPPGYTDGLRYVGTFQLEDEGFVGHVLAWEEVPRP